MLESGTWNGQETKKSHPHYRDQSFNYKEARDKLVSVVKDRMSINQASAEWHTHCKKTYTSLLSRKPDEGNTRKIYTLIRMALT